MYTVSATDRDGRVVASAVLDQQVMTIGRAPDCRMVLADAGVSRKHASLYLQDDGTVVVNDEGSANGVKVDGVFISGPTVVGPASRIEIAGFALTLAQERQGSASPVAARGEEYEHQIDTVLMPKAQASELVGRRMELVGRGGPFDGTRFRLGRPLMTVGRAAECDIVLDDPSISRVHAQVRLSAESSAFTLLDMRSANGTFVGGQRVKRAQCGPGAIVRFGDLAFRVSFVGDERPRASLAPSRRVLLFGGILVAVILTGAGIVATIRRPKPPPAATITAEERLRQLQAAVQKDVEDGTRALAQRRWRMAEESLGRALHRDPLHAEARRLRERAVAELKNMQTYVRGAEAFALGNRENLVKAKEVFLRVPTDSVYHSEARDKVLTINERLADGYRGEGLSLCRAKYWEQCHEALCRFFALLPEGKVVVGESGIREDLRAVESRLARKKGFSPCRAARFLQPVLAPGERPADVIAERYEDPALRGVVLLYFDGHIENALKTLATLRADKEMRPLWATLREMNSQLLTVHGKFQEGFTAHRERDVARARGLWDVVLAADSALVPPRIESFYRREIKRALGDLYFELGDEDFKLMRYPQAYAQWIQGKAVSPAHERVLNGLLQLEVVAERMVREAREHLRQGSIAEARAKLTVAREITEENRPAHEDAVRALAELR